MLGILCQAIVPALIQSSPGKQMSRDQGSDTGGNQPREGNRAKFKVYNHPPWHRTDQT